MGLNVDWAALRQELLDMAEEDLRVRADLAADGSLYRGYDARMRAVHDRNANRLARILSERGWPGEARVGPDAAQAAWLIAEHAIVQPAFQRQALSALSAAARRGEVPAWQVVSLEDRIRTFEGRPQRYGTQFDWDASGQLNPLPIEDPLGVDERRQAVGFGHSRRRFRLSGRRCLTVQSARQQTGELGSERWTPGFARLAGELGPSRAAASQAHAGRALQF